jgi:deoxyribodipyrimidine photo-lyase
MFRKQLYWRDFYMQIGYHFPKVYGNNFKNNIKWINNEKHFDKWCKGKTGYDIVDACMNQLNKSGFMHNRGRMIVASFLTKILHIDWRWGERYFATRLTDYDPANNNGGWQWSAGTGVDAQPYFRIFNPYTQAEKFDPDGAYRKKWLSRGHIDEIVDYSKEREKALTLILK